MKRIISSLSMLALSACATQPLPSIYNTPPVRPGVISQVVMGQIISVKPVLIGGGTTYIGMGTGAAVGAIAGSSIGHNRGSAIGGLLGGVFGGAVGSSVQQSMQEGPGIEMVIVNQYRQTIAIDQPNYGEVFMPGDMVKIIMGSPIRVTH